MACLSLWFLRMWASGKRCSQEIHASVGNCSELWWIKSSGWALQAFPMFDLQDHRSLQTKTVMLLPKSATHSHKPPSLLFWCHVNQQWIQPKYWLKKKKKQTRVQNMYFAEGKVGVKMLSWDCPLWKVCCCYIIRRILLWQPLSRDLDFNHQNVSQHCQQWFISFSSSKRH